MLAVLVAVEVVTRVKLFHLSKDFVDFLSYPGRAAALARADGTRVAILGNSVAHEGIDPQILAQSMGEGRAGRVHADIFSADRSYIDTWHFVMRRYFWRPGNRVDLVLVPFWGDNLYDGNPLELGRMAQFFTVPADWPEVLRFYLPSTSARAEFLVSGVWASFAARDRMQQWVFTHTLPTYREFALGEQSVAMNHQTLASAGRTPRARSAHALRRFLRLARQQGTRLCFVAVPTLHPEWNDPYTGLVRLMGRAGMHYLDLRGIPDVDARSYVDRVHMNVAGRAAFSRRLGHALDGLVRPMS